MLKGGLVIDGWGGEPMIGDVAIMGDRIFAVGVDLERLSLDAPRVRHDLPATGTLVWA